MYQAGSCTKLQSIAVRVCTQRLPTLNTIQQHHDPQMATSSFAQEKPQTIQLPNPQLAPDPAPISSSSIRFSAAVTSAALGRV